ncbi:MAG TPA: hydrogenase formation protein HypD, partial [Candidatus Latescibacteria bacterium]|nr:hydrogenase formation protein HypD [Candidatus Latescibacterota bacterium]
MRYIDAFQDGDLARKLAHAIRELIQGQEFSFMEVCGTHTVSAFRSGLRSLLPEGLELRPGPGCPVCVTPNAYLDRAIALGRSGVVLATFGDMLRVPGSSSSLLRERTRGMRVQVVYSPLDALRLAQETDRTVVFLAVGFETTAPAVAATVLEARRRNIHNFRVLVAHKLIPPAMQVLLEDPDVRIDGFLCPGHVSVVIGSQPYRSLAEDCGVPCAIAGFEPLDMLQGIYLLARQRVEGRAEVEIAYRRAVRPEGNTKARRLIDEVFKVV